MTINQIKELTRFLTEEEVEQIKKEIKSKEDVLKKGNLNEEEMIEVLNTLFAVLVIEKALESEIEGVEEIREELEQELVECYNMYDSYMAKYRKEDKKKKKRWLLEFLGLSENIRSRKKDINASSKTITNLQQQLENLKKQRSEENLEKVVEKQDDGLYKKFCDCPHECKDPRNHEYHRERHHHHHHDHRNHFKFKDKVPINIERNIRMKNIKQEPTENKKEEVKNNQMTEEKVNLDNTRRVKPKLRSM